MQKRGAKHEVQGQEETQAHMSLLSFFRWFATTDFQNFRGKDLQEIVNFFAIAVTVVVIAVPEGLPLAVTLT